jgi:hypothetical protein
VDAEELMTKLELSEKLMESVLRNPLLPRPEVIPPRVGFLETEEVMSVFDRWPELEGRVRPDLNKLRRRVPDDPEVQKWFRDRDEVVREYLGPRLPDREFELVLEPLKRRAGVQRVTHSDRLELWKKWQGNFGPEFERRVSSLVQRFELNPRLSQFSSEPWDLGQVDALEWALVERSAYKFGLIDEEDAGLREIESILIDTLLEMRVEGPHQLELLRVGAAMVHAVYQRVGSTPLSKRLWKELMVATFKVNYLLNNNSKAKELYEQYNIMNVAMLVWQLQPLSGLDAFGEMWAVHADTMISRTRRFITELGILFEWEELRYIARLVSPATYKWSIYDRVHGPSGLLHRIVSSLYRMSVRILAERGDGQIPPAVNERYVFYVAVEAETLGDRRMSWDKLDREYSEALSALRYACRIELPGSLRMSYQSDFWSRVGRFADELRHWRYERLEIDRAVSEVAAQLRMDNFAIRTYGSDRQLDTALMGRIHAEMLLVISEALCAQFAFAALTGQDRGKAIMDCLRRLRQKGLAPDRLLYPLAPHPHEQGGVGVGVGVLQVRNERDYDSWSPAQRLVDLLASHAAELRGVSGVGLMSGERWANAVGRVDRELRSGYDSPRRAVRVAQTVVRNAVEALVAARAAYELTRAVGRQASSMPVPSGLRSFTPVESAVNLNQASISGGRLDRQHQGFRRRVPWDAPDSVVGEVLASELHETLVAQGEPDVAVVMDGMELIGLADWAALPLSWRKAKERGPGFPPAYSLANQAHQGGSGGPPGEELLGSFRHLSLSNRSVSPPVSSRGLGVGGGSSRSTVPVPGRSTSALGSHGFAGRALSPSGVTGRSRTPAVAGAGSYRSSDSRSLAQLEGLFERESLSRESLSRLLGDLPYPTGEEHGYRPVDWSGRAVAEILGFKGSDSSGIVTVEDMRESFLRENVPYLRRGEPVLDPLTVRHPAARRTHEERLVVWEKLINEKRLLSWSEGSASHASGLSENSYKLASFKFLGLLDNPAEPRLGGIGSLGWALYEAVAARLKLIPESDSGLRYLDALAVRTMLEHGVLSYFDEEVRRNEGSLVNTTAHIWDWLADLRGGLAMVYYAARLSNVQLTEGAWRHVASEMAREVDRLGDFVNASVNYADSADPSIRLMKVKLPLLVWRLSSRSGLDPVGPVWANLVPDVVNAVSFVENEHAVLNPSFFLDIARIFCPVQLRIADNDLNRVVYRLRALGAPESWTSDLRLRFLALSITGYAIEVHLRNEQVHADFSKVFSKQLWKANSNISRRNTQEEIDKVLLSVTGAVDAAAALEEAGLHSYMSRLHPQLRRQLWRAVRTRLAAPRLLAEQVVSQLRVDRLRPYFPEIPLEGILDIVAKAARLRTVSTDLKELIGVLEEVAGKGPVLEELAVKGPPEDQVERMVAWFRTAGLEPLLPSVLRFKEAPGVSEAEAVLVIRGRRRMVDGAPGRRSVAPVRRLLEVIVSEVAEKLQVLPEMLMPDEKFTEVTLKLAEKWEGWGKEEAVGKALGLVRAAAREFLVLKAAADVRSPAPLVSGPRSPAPSVGGLRAPSAPLVGGLRAPSAPLVGGSRSAASWSRWTGTSGGLVDRNHQGDRTRVPWDAPDSVVQAAMALRLHKALVAQGGPDAAVVMDGMESIGLADWAALPLAWRKAKERGPGFPSAYSLANQAHQGGSGDPASASNMYQEIVSAMGSLFLSQSANSHYSDPPFSRDEGLVVWPGVPEQTVAALDRYWPSRSLYRKETVSLVLPGPYVPTLPRSSEPVTAEQLHTQFRRSFTSDMGRMSVLVVWPTPSSAASPRENASSTFWSPTRFSTPAELYNSQRGLRRELYDNLEELLQYFARIVARDVYLPEYGDSADFDPVQHDFVTRSSDGSRGEFVCINPQGERESIDSQGYGYTYPQVYRYLPVQQAVTSGVLGNYENNPGMWLDLTRYSSQGVLLVRASDRWVTKLPKPVLSGHYVIAFRIDDSGLPLIPVDRISRESKGTESRFSRAIRRVIELVSGGLLLVGGASAHAWRGQPIQWMTDGDLDPTWVQEVEKYLYPFKNFGSQFHSQPRSMEEQIIANIARSAVNSAFSWYEEVTGSPPPSRRQGMWQLVARRAADFTRDSAWQAIARYVCLAEGRVMEAGSRVMDIEPILRFAKGLLAGGAYLGDWRSEFDSSRIGEVLAGEQLTPSHSNLPVVGDLSVKEIYDRAWEFTEHIGFWLETLPREPQRVNASTQRVYATTKWVTPDQVNSYVLGELVTMRWFTKATSDECAVSRGNVLFVIRGVNHRFVTDSARSINENEYLFPGRTTFKVTDRHQVLGSIPLRLKEELREKLREELREKFGEELLPGEFEEYYDPPWDSRDPSPSIPFPCRGGLRHVIYLDEVTDSVTRGADRGLLSMIQPIDGPSRHSSSARSSRLVDWKYLETETQLRHAEVEFQRSLGLGDAYGAAGVPTSLATRPGSRKRGAGELTDGGLVGAGVVEYARYAGSTGQDWGGGISDRSVRSPGAVSDLGRNSPGLFDDESLSTELLSRLLGDLPAPVGQKDESERVDLPMRAMAYILGYNRNDASDWLTGKSLRVWFNSLNLQPHTVDRLIDPLAVRNPVTRRTHNRAASRTTMDQRSPIHGLVDRNHQESQTRVPWDAPDSVVEAAMALRLHKALVAQGGPDAAVVMDGMESIGLADWAALPLSWRKAKERGAGFPSAYSLANQAHQGGSGELPDEDWLGSFRSLDLGLGSAPRSGPSRGPGLGGGGSRQTDPERPTSSRFGPRGIAERALPPSGVTGRSSPPAVAATGSYWSSDLRSLDQIENSFRKESLSRESLSRLLGDLPPPTGGDDWLYAARSAFGPDLSTSFSADLSMRAVAEILGVVERSPFGDLSSSIVQDSFIEMNRQRGQREDRPIDPLIVRHRATRQTREARLALWDKLREKKELLSESRNRRLLISWSSNALVGLNFFWLAGYIGATSST